MLILFPFRQTLRATACSVLAHIKSKAMDYSVLGIDEGQFVSLTDYFPFLMGMVLIQIYTG